MLGDSKRSRVIGHDVVIVGTGAAGLALALKLPEHLNIALVCKAPMGEGASSYAQGGIAAVLSEEDSFESHIHDTLAAGHGLCHPERVKAFVEAGPKEIDWLIGKGVPFCEQNPNILHLTQEGGHQFRRIAHVKDATGKAIMTQLIKNIQKRQLTLYDSHLAIDLITPSPLKCAGIYLYALTTKKVITLQAKTVVLATGGASRAYFYNTNPNVASGDGIAMAYRAGARISNMEFNQFHPTCLYHPHAGAFLLTEAIRGEGGLLKLPNGKRFMAEFDKREELAPRDIVARAIDFQIKKYGISSVFLDISHRESHFIKSHFPSIYQKCLSLGLDMTKEPLPVVPAAHYTCGGILTDINGKTDIQNLYAIGEVAATGLHGANRIASNSLLECLVLAENAAQTLQAKRLENEAFDDNIPLWDDSRVSEAKEQVMVRHDWEELRRLMSDYVGIVRSDERLQRAKRRIDLLRSEIQTHYSHFRITPDLLELRNLVEVSDLIVQSATFRKESRGLHCNVDHPHQSNYFAQDTIIHPPQRKSSL